MRRGTHGSLPQPWALLGGEVLGPDGGHRSGGHPQRHRRRAAWGLPGHRGLRRGRRGHSTHAWGTSVIPTTTAPCPPPPQVHNWGTCFKLKKAPQSTRAVLRRMTMTSCCAVVDAAPLGQSVGDPLLWVLKRSPIPDALMPEGFQTCLQNARGRGRPSLPPTPPTSQMRWEC